MVSEDPDVSAFRDGVRDFIVGFVRVEVVLFGFHGVQLQDEVLDLRRSEAGFCQVVIVQVKVHEGCFQLFLIPVTADFVQGDVQGLLGLLVYVGHEDAGFRVAEVL